MEKKFITKLADLEPLFIKDHFVCLFTGHELSSAYLIGGKYGSFYDPIIAATYIQVQLRNTISEEHFSKFQEMIIQDSNNLSAPFFPDISCGTFKDFTNGGKYEGYLYEHLSRFNGKFRGLLTEASDYAKIKETKKPRKKSIEQQNQMFFYALSDEKLCEEKKIKTNEMVNLDLLFPGLKMTIVNTRPGNMQIYLSNSDPPEMNPQANSLIGKHLVSDSHKGTVVIVSKTAISP